jgi:YidC/Oxa1 family membrane protein insertase
LAQQQAAQKPQIDPKQLRKSLLIWGLVAVVVIAGSQIGFSTIWREGIIRPMLNALLFFYAYLGHSFVAAIAAITILLRLITMPLQIKQIRSSKMMANLQPRIAEMQKKYAGNKEKIAQEQQRLYKEANVNPLGGCLPTLIQFPIWISLYQGINSVLADTPIELMSLGQSIYTGFAKAVEIIPLQSVFLGMDLAKPDPTRIVLPVLVAGTMWLQQKMMTQPSADQQQASMNQTMQLMMPLMFGYFTTQFASGLALYFVISNVVGIALQWVVQKISDAGDAPAADEGTAKKKATYDTKKS